MRRFLPVLLLTLLLVSCGKEPAAPSVRPAVQPALSFASAFRAGITVKTIQAASVRYGCGLADGAAPALPQTAATPGTGPETIEIELDGLQPETDYLFVAQGIGPAGEEGLLEQLRFSTRQGPSSRYAWELERGEIPVPADMTLIPGPSSHRTPLAWDLDRWHTHVSYTDENGLEHWLFDSFLLIEGQQTGVYGTPGYTYVLTETATPSAPKALWQQLLDFWFDGGTFEQQESYWGDGKTTFGRWYTGAMVTPSPVFASGQLDALDACIDEVAARIGPPPTKRFIIMGMPEPIYFDNYIAAVNNPAGASSRYWGSVDGEELDFSRVEDRVRACRWFIDETRASFARKHYKNIELLGFYILPEILDTKWRAEYKRYDEVIPAVADYLHACSEGLYWIPYCMAPGYTQWKSFGIDIAYMQPNYYWDETGEKPMSKTFGEINRYGMGLELEFEYSMVEAVAGASSAAKYRARFDDYLSWAKSSGVYGTRSIALYSGTDAMHQLANSELPADRETYRRLCHFILESPLKK